MNGSTLNNKTWYYSFNLPVAEQIAFIVAYLIFFFVAFVGNSFIIHVARKVLAAGRGPFPILVINMAASDILYAVTIVSLEVKWRFVGPQWIPGGFGTFLCKFWFCAAIYAISSSILTLTAMTVDRYLAIVPNAKRPMRKKTVMEVIFAIGLISLACSSFFLFRMNIVSGSYQTKNYTFCIMFYVGVATHVAEKLIKAEYLCYFVLHYVIPVVLMSFLYCRIVRFLWLRKIPGNKTDTNERKRRKQTKKVIYMLIAMAASFTFTWFPVHVANYYRVNGWMLSFSVRQFLFWLCHTNCATNPCFYFIFCKDYNDELRRFFRQSRVSAAETNRIESGNLS